MLVQQFLQNGGTLADLESRYGIDAKRHGKYPNLVLLKYNQIESPMGEPIVQECRGLILDENDSWKVISRPFDKFFNIEEGHAAKIDWSTARVYEKLDGSLMTLYWYRNAWEVSSSGSPDASGPVNNDSSMTFADLFWKVWEEKGYRLPTQPDPEDEYYSYMFELMTPYNRVVVPHIENRLVLLGVRELINFEEFPPQLPAESVNWEYVKTFDITDFASVTREADKLNPMQQEGFVVVDANFNRVKVKSPQYVAIHHMKDGFSDRRMIDLVRANEGSEFLGYFPEYKPLYDKIRSAYDALVAETEAAYEEIKSIDTQKDFALRATKFRCSGALFSLRAKKVNCVKDYLKDISVQNLERLIL